MSKNKLPVLGEKSFEDLKHFNQHRAEYLNAREIQPMLGYSQWRRFEDAIKRAMISCEKSGNESANHFAGAGKMVELGSGSQREVPDYKGLYGGLGRGAIKTRKKIPAKEQLMDRMGTTELAANQFRMTQTRDKLARERVKNQEHAIQTQI